MNKNKIIHVKHTTVIHPRPPFISIIMLDADLTAISKRDQVRRGVREALQSYRAVRRSPFLPLVDIDSDDRHPTVHSRDPGGRDLSFVVDLVCAFIQGNIITSVDKLK
jgi:hypothetical protein